MTEQRSLKRLVRERMTRTAEAYETAHRQVTARRETSDVSPGYPVFGHENHRPSALVRHLLAQAGLDISAPMACGLGGGIGFLYAVFEYKQVSHPLLTIVAQHHPQPWLDAAAEHLAIATSAVTSSSPAAALGKLDATLERGQAAQLTVARGLLPWHGGVPAEESADPYAIVVAGRDGDHYLVDDGIAEPRRIDAEQFGSAWTAHRKGRFAITTIDPIANAVDLAAAVRAAIDTTVRHLTGPVLGNSFDVNMGLSGMAKLADELRGTTTKTGWLRRFGTPEGFGIGMTRLADCLTWAYTAQGATRPLYSRFVAEAGPIAGLDLDAAAQAAADAGEGWMLVADAARRCVIRIRPIDDLRRTGRPRRGVHRAREAARGSARVGAGLIRVSGGCGVARRVSGGCGAARRRR